MKKLLLIIVLLPCLSIAANAVGKVNRMADITKVAITRQKSDIKPTAVKTFQAFTLKGLVHDASGQPLPGVSVRIKGTTTGVQTDANGKFSISANTGDILIFSFVGYAKKEVKVTSNADLNVQLADDSKSLTEVVVTALGVKRSQKSLVYSNQLVGGNQINDVKTDNFINALDGKVVGVDISPSSSGVGGSTKIILRGNKSIQGDNQPLYVVDGVPLLNVSNSNGQPNSTYGGSPDGGDGISNLNSDDIEGVTILTGAASSALYGNRAANGVVLVTMKKGKVGEAIVGYSSSYTNDAIAYKPQFQNQYGVTPNGNESWGPKLATTANTASNVSDFFQNGNFFTNTVSFSSGSDANQLYLSYGNSSANGVQPTNTLHRNNFTFRETSRYLDNKLTVDLNAYYVTKKLYNTPYQGFYFNTLPGLYLFPVGTDISQYKTNYGVPDATRNGLLNQNWIANEDIQQNPWWILNKNPNTFTRDRLFANATVKYDINNWLNIQARGSVDRNADRTEQDLYAGTNPVLTKGNNGSFSAANKTATEMYGDLIANFKVPMHGDFKVDGLIGGSITDDNTYGAVYGPGTGLAIPNVFIQQNVVTSGTSNVSTIPAYHTQIQSIFGSANISYHDWAYLTITERNDWSSSLAFTTKNSYSYPSVGLSLILNEMLDLPKFISFAKLRGSYAEVAIPVPPYITNPLNYSASGGSVNFNSVQPNPLLKPTNTKSTEFGIDGRLFDNRLGFAFTWYKANSYNQFIQYTPPASTGYSVAYLNAGNVQNSGVEFRLDYDVLKQSDFTWNSAINFTSNKNKIIQLNPSDPNGSIVLTGAGNNAFESHATVGESFGDIYGVKFERSATGQIKVNAAGAPINDGHFVKLGNSTPKFQLGWGNRFDYKNFSFQFLISGKFGGQVLSMTQMVMDSYGVSAASGQARDAGGVTVNAVDPSGNAVTKVDAKTWYTGVGGRSGIAEPYIYSATAVRLRQFSLGYSIPVQSNFVKSLKLSLIGNNLFYFTKKAPYDPEITMSTANGLAGVDVFNQPTTRRIGASLNVTFK